jgi:hypothetical protein
MKRFVCTAFFLAIAATAFAQLTPHYAEIYNKSTGKLKCKQWVSGMNARIESTDEKTGSTMIMILRAAERKVLVINGNGTYMELDLDKFQDRSVAASAQETKDRFKKELINKEEVEGRMCEHYKMTDAKPDQTAGQVGQWEEWFSPELGVVVQTYDWDVLTDRMVYEVRRNIKVGEQPASLFEVPKGYKNAMPKMPSAADIEALKGRFDQPKKK